MKSLLKPIRTGPIFTQAYNLPNGVLVTLPGLSLILVSRDRMANCFLRIF